MRGLIKRLIPGFITRTITGLFYGWRGNYRSWEEASSRCYGYNADHILERVRESARRVIRSEVAYERDSVTFNEIKYNYHLLSVLMWAAARNQGNLHIMDYGGALGSTYYQHKTFLDGIPELNWSIVEQPGFVRAGMEEFAGERLNFYPTIEDCLKTGIVDLVLLSSVIQYLEKPYEVLEDILSRDIELIVFERTPFVKGKDRITIQKVKPAIYKASYPCWFFNEDRFRDFMGQGYELLIEFDALDRANVRSEFKGFVFRKKERDA